MSKSKEIPQKYRDMVGQRHTFKGSLFGRKAIEATEFDVLDIRPSSRFIMNMETRKKYAAYELLLKNDSMRASRWSLPFAIRE